MSHIDNPKIIFCQVIDPFRIEIFWNQDVIHANDPDNYTLRLDHSEFPIFKNDHAEWNEMNVYEPFKKKTTLVTASPINKAYLGRLTLTLNPNIKNSSNLHINNNEIYSINNWHMYYTKFSNCLCGIPIKSSEKVSYYAHHLTANIVDTMLSKVPQVTNKLLENGADISIYGLEEDVYDIPEHRGGAVIMQRPVEGYGGMPSNPTTSISAQNVLRVSEGLHQTRNLNESILVHEFSHAIHLLGINLLPDKKLSSEIVTAYEHAKNNKLWPNTYLISNYEEYFATLSTIWFNVMAESASGKWDGVRGPINTRSELKEYDSLGYQMLEKIYPKNVLPYPWNNNLVINDYTGNIDKLPL